MKLKPSTLWCLTALVVSISITVAFRLPIRQQITNSCVKCHDIDPKRINVHLVHHSHDDVGWLKTVDQYFWGLNSTIVTAGVQYIISSVVNALWNHPDRRFIQVETAFFWKWWNSQDDVMRAKFRTLLENGQLEIVNGGWVMNDEACVNYQSTIDQFTWGFRLLNETLGECGNPTMGWQIDPFGHSREHASLLSKIGFDGVFFARLDNNDRELRKKEKNMDFLWKGSANNDEVIFGGMFASDNIYYPPSGFCFDVRCDDDSIDDDPKNDAFNLNSKAALFAENIKNYIKYFKTNNVLITMGGDFQYQAAEINFHNSDKLIKAFKNNPEINLIYSTPTCYLKAVYDAQPSLVTKTDDFFPYGSQNHTYWAGYFTSRQNFKRLERISNNILQVAKQLNALAIANGNTHVNIDSIKGLREAIGNAQHHDSITGTAKQHVSRDYTKLLSRAIRQAEGAFTNLIGNLLNNNLSASTNVSSCLLANMSICTISQNSDKFVVVVYNPLSWPVSHAIRLPVDGKSFIVRGSDGELSYDVATPISNFSYVQLAGVQPAKHELVFLAADIPPLGIKSFHISKKSGQMENDIAQNLDNVFKFGNEEVGFELDNSTSLLKSVTMNGVTLQIGQQFLHYTSHNGTKNSDPSGAYIFRPNGTAISFGNPTIISRTQGKIVDEVHQKFNDWITQIIRVYKGSHDYIEFDWLVGPLNVSDGFGIEIISRFNIENFKNNKTFYTDSNGREMIRRVLNYQSTYTYNSSLEPIASNYYPVTSKITIKDEDQKLQVSILNDRSQGGSSLDEGQIELMVHRRTLRDDGKGVEEPMNETEFGQGIVARGQHYLILGPSSKVINGKTLSAQERILAQQKLLQPWVGVGDASKLSGNVTDKLFKAKYSALSKSLAENVNILTLEPWTNSSYILRVEHILEKNEDPTLSTRATIDLANLFSNLTITDVVETTLGANRQLKSFKRNYDWTYKVTNLKTVKQSISGTKVTISPMDIKTFIISIKKQ